MNTGPKLAIGSLILIAVLCGVLMYNSMPRFTRSTGASLVFFCAAGMQLPVDAVAQQYEKKFGTPVQIQYGGSGTSLSNLSISHQGDLYLAADETYIEIARSKNLIDEVLPIAYMNPIIAVQKGNPKNIQTLQDLTQSDIQIAIANPEAASIGKVTKTLLQKLNLWDALQERIRVMKPTVNDVANDVKIGSVDAGIIWDAVAAQYPELEILQVPEFPRNQWLISIAMLKSSLHPTEALRFARYLSARDKGLLTFDKMGYTPVDGDVWEEVPRVVFYSGGVNRVAIDETVNQFEQREGARVERVYNGCGILVSQMLAGQRPDAYFACDVSFSRQVADLFLDFTNVSQTAMVILVQKGNPKGIATLEDLTRPGLRVGMANPGQSALGALTTRLLDEIKIRDAFMKNVCAQTPTADLLVNQIQTGSLDAVVVYEANTTMVQDKLQLIQIDHPAAKAVQPFAVAKNSKHKYLMQRLYQVIRSKTSEKKFKSSGFQWFEDVPAEGHEKS